MQRQQLPTESQVLEDEVLPGTENADQPTEEMSERHDNSRNHIGKVRIELCAKSFILQLRRFGEAHHSLRRGGTDEAFAVSLCAPPKQQSKRKNSDYLEAGQCPPIAETFAQRELNRIRG
jgi:hypothetical protein